MPKLTIPNLNKTIQENPQLAESLVSVQNYVNANTAPSAGNKQAPPPNVNPTLPPG